MAGGLPAADAFPVDEIRTVTARLLHDDPTSLLQYSTTEGFPELRVVDRRAGRDEPRPRGRRPDQVLITHGSQQALDLVSKVFVEPGVEVAIDEPGYIGAIQALQVFEPTLLPVPVDEHGLEVSGARRSLLEAGHRPRLLYTVVNFQNPTGATLALERRMHLAELAEQYGFVIVEDDPYWALRFAGEQLPSIATWSDNVISLGTFSKLVVPGLRVGYAVAPTWAREHLAKVKQGADLHTSSWGQVLLTALVVRARVAVRPHRGARARLRHPGAGARRLARRSRGRAVRVQPTRGRHVPVGSPHRWPVRDRPAAEGGRAGDGVRPGRAVLLRAARLARRCA